MLIVRPIRDGDIDGLLRLAEAAYPGMTTLPPDREVLSKKIKQLLGPVDYLKKNQKQYLIFLIFLLQNTKEKYQKK